MLAMSSLPSADRAAQVHAALGALLETQEMPESAEVQIPPPEAPRVNPLLAAAASFVPSAEEATLLQLFVGKSAGFQFTPASVEI